MMNSAAMILCATALALGGCKGSKTDGPREEGETSNKISGMATFLNGPTATTTSLSLPKLLRVEPAAASGDWALTPDVLTMTVVGISFLKTTDTSGYEENATLGSATCQVTYRRTEGSLATLKECPFTVAAGTYVGVAVDFNTTYSVQINDMTNGIYTDASKPGLLSLTEPAGGAQTVSFIDPNGNGNTNRTRTYFPTPLVVAEGTPPEINVIFDPTHWFYTNITGSDIQGLTSGGGPPVVPSASAVAKAAYYSAAGTTGNFLLNSTFQSSQFGFLVFYTDATTPTSLIGRVGGICKTGSTVDNAYNSNGTEWGRWGYLGRTTDGYLGWALPSVDANNQYTGYRAVARMAELDVVGATASLSYACTASPPAPLSGSIYSAAGEPSFTPDGTITLTLLAK